MIHRNYDNECNISGNRFISLLSCIAVVAFFGMHALCLQSYGKVLDVIIISMMPGILQIIDAFCTLCMHFWFVKVSLIFF